MNMPLELHTEAVSDDILVYRISGRLDAIEAPEASDRMVEGLSDRNRVVLDLQEVEYISSGGLSIIIRLIHRLRSAGGDLYLANPHPFARKVLDIVSFDAIMKIFDTTEEATAAF
jgi:anti-sigma B factor antagonist